MITQASITRRVALASSFILATFVSNVTADPVGPELTPKLRGLLIKEMIQVELAMHEVFSAIIQGRHDTVADKGQSIHDSFIMAQSLTDEDRQDLKAAVPPEFLMIDTHLHELSAALAEAGRAEDTARQVELFGRMTETCVACHSTYVTDRFEGLSSSDIPSEWVKTSEDQDERSEH